MNNKREDVRVTTTRSLIDGEWHFVSLEINDPDLLFIVDNDSEILTVPIEEKVGPFRGPLRLGGTDQ